MNDLAFAEELMLEPWPDDADLPLDAAQMEGHDQIRLIKAQQELVSYATARLYRSMVDLVDTIAASDDLDSDAPEEAAAAEIACCAAPHGAGRRQ